MGRRSSSSSSSSGGAAAKSKKDTKAQPCESSVVSKLQMLRDFVGTSTWSEKNLSSCLRQCGYNVELAAERLMTGQFQGTQSLTRGTDGQRKSSFFTMSSSSDGKGVSSSKSFQQQPDTASAATVTSSTIKRRRETPPSSRKKVATNNTASSSGPVHVVTPGVNSAVKFKNTPTPSSPSDGPLLLCQRWVVGCCTTRHGHVSYQEKLSISNSLAGPPVVRFRGYSMEGTLPGNLGAMLTPLLRYNQQEGRESKLISIKAEGLMEARQVPIGGEVPLSLSIYLEAPLEFFQIFEQEHESVKGGNSMKSVGKKQRHFHVGRGNNNKKMKLSEAAFALLQWAEYGDVPEFHPPSPNSEDDDKQSPTHQQQSEQPDKEDSDEEDFTSLEVLREEEMDTHPTADGEDATNQQFTQVLANSSHLTASLPEMDNPIGFNDGVVLRSYQRQALYWMMNRESNGSEREETERELSLLQELVPQKSKPPNAASDWAAGTGSQDDVRCECGPVLVSEAAAKRSMTLDGEVNPVNHPLWRRRFLSSMEKETVISFYVNELLGTATHKPPNPPRQCVGGILADSMGLGKTVMLLALILKEKEEAQKNNTPTGATLIIAPLSLVAQWEEEISTKTSLTYSVHYGDKTRTTFGSENQLDVDVVVTTYGTIQGELQTRLKQNSGQLKGNALLDYDWHRVILDEAHSIKNGTTLACKACCMIKAKRRWCVSGTIIQNSLDDVFALLKFLRHEPWCAGGFWKAAVTSVMRRNPQTESAENTAVPTEVEATGLVVAMDRVRRLLLPIMLRRTKDSLSKDGTPILTLPPVETSVVQVQFSPAEREFYNSLLLKSQDVFDGFLKAGTASKSWLAIFSLLHRLRQACDHVALTVKSHMDDSEWNAPRAKAELKEETAAAAAPDAVSDEFLKDLLKKFRSNHSMESADQDQQGSSDVDQTTAYSQVVAKSLSDAVKSGSTSLTEECSICLEMPLVQDAVVTPCAHIFCRSCLVGYLRDKSNENLTGNKATKQGAPCSTAECPYCNETMDATRIIALSKSSVNGQTTTSFLRGSKSPQKKKMKTATCSARAFLEQSLRGAGSSKLSAVLDELHNVWKQDPGSKVLIFSQFLGFLDLMEGALREDGISFGRLDGSMSLQERVKVLDRFKTPTAAAAAAHSNSNDDNDNIKHVRGSVLLISMKAGGVGINLVAASSVFIVDPWWNAAVEDQCVNRIHRIGQTAKVVRVRKFVVVDSVEERIIELQKRKKGIANQVFGDGVAGVCGGDAAEDGSASNPTLDDMRLLFGK